MMMAIVINGIDMPETCSDCMFEDWYPDEREFSLCCLILDHAITDGVRDTGRLDNCPLRKTTEPKPRETATQGQTITNSEGPYGWMCPKCGRGLAPWVSECNHGCVPTILWDGSPPYERIVYSDHTEVKDD